MPAEIVLAIFARAPIAGRTKTRLAESIGAEHAARLYSAFLADTIALASTVARAELWAASEEDRVVLQALYPELRCLVQSGADLGQRMEGALRHGIDRAGRAAVLGTDAPTIPQSLLREALTALDEQKVVLGPADDGGYWLLGARGQVPDLSGVRWSTRHALADTHARYPQAWLTKPWHDIDLVADLDRLRHDLRADPAVAPATRAALASFDQA